MNKVAIIHFAYPPNIGGVEILLKEHALELSDLGYSVKILTGSGEEDDKRIELVRKPEFQSLMEYDPVLQDEVINKGILSENFYELSKKIELILEEELKDADTVIVHNLMTIKRNLALNLALREFANKHNEKRFIIWVHDHQYINEEKIKENLQEIYHIEEINKLMTEVIPGAYYIVISETFKNLLIQVMKIDDSKLVVIPGGLLIKQILGSSDALWKLIEERDILKKFPILITPANILERKNIEYAIEVVFSLKSKFPDIIYLISGKTSVHRNTNKYREELGIKIKELGLEQNVIFAGEEIGPLSYEDVCCLYRLADAVFYFSKSENFGIPILESAINKTPIFTSNLAALNELGGDHVEYVDYKETAPEKASEIISNYLENDNLTKLRRRVRSKYYLKNILKEKLIPLLA